MIAITVYLILSVLASLLAIAACMVSSRISQQEQLTENISQLVDNSFTLDRMADPASF